MISSAKFYKIKLINRLLEYTHRLRTDLLHELTTNATDPVVFKRRLRMLRHVNSYESQLLQKIENFETDDIQDLVNFDVAPFLKDITWRSS
jgi:hypothetical protein